MQTTTHGDATTPRDDGPPMLDVALVDRAMAAKGAKSKAEHARRFGLNVTHYFNIRAGRRIASLPTALAISDVTEEDIKALFPRRAKKVEAA
jgi:hypothetical protein